MGGARLPSPAHRSVSWRARLSPAQARPQMKSDLRQPPEQALYARSPYHFTCFNLGGMTQNYTTLPSSRVRFAWQLQSPDDAKVDPGRAISDGLSSSHCCANTPMQPLLLCVVHCPPACERHKNVVIARVHRHAVRVGTGGDVLQPSVGRGVDDAHVPGHWACLSLPGSIYCRRSCTRPRQPRPR